jgi:hypothetical protein
MNRPYEDRRAMKLSKPIPLVLTIVISMASSRWPASSIISWRIRIDGDSHDRQLSFGDLVAKAEASLASHLSPKTKMICPYTNVWQIKRAILATLPPTSRSWLDGIHCGRP